MTQPTGVFVRLYNGELSDQQTKDMLAGATDMKNKGGTYTQAMTAAILATGNPVTGGDLNPVAFMSPRDCASPSISFRPFHDYIPLVRQSDHQAAIAALEAEVGRLRNVVGAARTSIATGNPMKAAYVLETALKGPEA